MEKSAEIGATKTLNLSWFCSSLSSLVNSLEFVYVYVRRVSFANPSTYIEEEKPQTSEFTGQNRVSIESQRIMQT